MCERSKHKQSGNVFQKAFPAVILNITKLVLNLDTAKIYLYWNIKLQNINEKLKNSKMFIKFHFK